jgi:hypothetical protein
MADLVNVAPAQCRVQVDSTSQISLQRYQGKFLPLKIGAAWEAKIIPSSGPTLANTGLTAATLYYVYAFDSSGTLTLEAVTTVPATDADTGVRIKTGDATRTLVGMVFMDAGTPGTFVDSTAKRWCLNWFNRRALDLTGTYSADRTTTSTTLAEVNTEIRLQFLTWADEAVAVGASGTMSNSGAGQASGTGLGIDSTTVATQIGAFTSTGANLRGPIGAWASKTLSEGSHFAALLGVVSGGTCTWATADAVETNGAAKTRLWATVRG